MAIFKTFIYKRFIATAETFVITPDAIPVTLQFFRTDFEATKPYKSRQPEKQRKILSVANRLQEVYHNTVAFVK